MSTIIPLKNEWPDAMTGERLNSFENWEHQEHPEGGEMLVLTLSDQQAAQLAAMLFSSLGSEKVSRVFDDPELVEALERYEEHD